jgi:hypothetical protein
VLLRRALLACSLTCVLTATAAADGNLGGLFGPAPRAQPAGPVPELDAIAAELDALAKHPDAAVAAGPIEHGRIALAAARELQTKDPAAAERAKQIAWAALSLAGRRIAIAESTRAAAAADLRAAAAEADRARTEQAVTEARARLEKLRASAEAAR